MYEIFYRVFAASIRSLLEMDPRSHMDVSACFFCAVAGPSHAVQRIFLPMSSKRILLERLCSIPGSIERPELFDAAVLQITEYLAGLRSIFDFPVLNPKTTKFEMKVYQATGSIPYGQTQAYGQIAQNIGCPRGSRAVGQALAKNPLPLVIPCHRVVLSDGNIGGFGGGSSLKRLLLTLETIPKQQPKTVLG